MRKTALLLSGVLLSGCTAAVIAGNASHNRWSPRKEGVAILGVGLLTGALSAGLALDDGCKSHVEPVSLSGMPDSGRSSNVCVPTWGGYVIAPFAISDLFAGTYQVISGKYLFKTETP